MKTWIDYLQNNDQEEVTFCVIDFIDGKNFPPERYFEDTWI